MSPITQFHISFTTVQGSYIQHKQYY